MKIDKIEHAKLNEKRQDILMSNCIQNPISKHLKRSISDAATTDSTISSSKPAQSNINLQSNGHKKSGIKTNPPARKKRRKMKEKFGKIL